MARLSDDATLRALTEETQRIWESKAAFWDEQMGEGNAFQRVLVGPAAERSLKIQPGDHVLDVACGNGVFSRRLAALGAQVVATDFSPTFLERARARSSDAIDYILVDATDEEQLLALGVGRFDAAVCNMAIQDMTMVEPMFRALTRLLKPRGRLVFSVPHPAFNISAGTKLTLEEDDRNGTLIETYAVKVANYLHVAPAKGVGMPNEPAPHYYFHRPLHTLLGVCFTAGFVMDGLEEPAFGVDDRSARALGWGNFKDIPPVLVARLRPSKGLAT